MYRVPPTKLSDVNYYMPHHAVIKPDSTTTKVRVVFNASSPSSNGLSLNDILHTGPILQGDLSIIILKWRFYQYVFNADIQKMYRQILVEPEHSKFQRILFRSDPCQSIEDYELKTVTFGVNCAPYLAIRTILQLAEDVAEQYPLASNILRHSTYADDILAGAHSVEDAVSSRKELVLALASAGFSLRKWTSNSKKVLTGIPPEHRLREDLLELDSSSSAKTLGVRWNAMSDLFYFTAKPMPESSVCTKRKVLSQIARLFDPAGWLAPCVVMAKILMQRIWIAGTKWDEIIPQDILQEWTNFQSNYSEIDKIKIPRYIDFIPNAEIQFHGFCYASERAYAAAIYIRIDNGCTVSSHLIACKTKVAPVKTLSIPRLELCGAVLLAEMIDSLIPHFDIEKYTLFCWTDSTIVLSWLAKPPCAWLTFVANRVSKIIQITRPSMWNHVSSESNPADIASRGMYPKDLINNSLWWHGPDWLNSQQDHWPKSDKPNIVMSDIEKKIIKVHFSYFPQFEDILERFSSFPRAMRILAYVFRFFHNAHPKHKPQF